MGSWIYLYAKFTEEALLVWGTLACVSAASYSVFWILKKRRLGVAANAVPSSLVKVYLNELISEARMVRGQLFGLAEDASQGTQGPSAGSALAASITASVAKGPEVVVQTGANAPSGATAGAAPASPELQAAVSKLETKAAEQDKTIQSLATEKQTLLQQIETLKKAPTATGVATSGGDVELKKKLKDLEDRLSEYSIIEDDLANLKRLQQENQELKAKLGLAPAAAEPAPKSVEAAPAPEAPAPEAPVPTAEPAPEPAPEPVEAAPQAETPAAPAASFEKVVDQVEASLATPTPAPAPTAAAAPASTPAPAEAKKSDEDLLSEFEKMLGG